MLIDKKIVQYSPIILFVWLARFNFSWEIAFLCSGAIAIILLGVLLFLQRLLDRFVIAVYCFLIAGAVMIVGNIVFLQNVYEYFMQAMLPFWLFLVGLISTLVTKEGFIGVVSKQREKVYLYSWYLVGASALAFGFSFLFKGNMIIAGMVPFILLKILQAKLQKLAQ